MATPRALIVVAAGVNYTGNRLGVQHIAEQLSHHLRVLYVDPPLSPVSAMRKPWLRPSLRPPLLRQVGPTLWRMTPVVPPGTTRWWGRGAAQAAARHQLRSAVRRLGGPVEAVMQVPPHFRWFGVEDERVRIHLASDDFVAMAPLSGVSQRWVAAREAEVAAEADVVVAVSSTLVDHWRALGHDPIFMPNGCDYSLLATAQSAEPAPDVDLPRPIAGYIGTVSDRTDAAILERLADTGQSILIVGPRSATAPNGRLDPVFERPNVQWVGARDYRDVPSYAAHMSVGLVPYLATRFNMASFPLKVLDYLAAGLAVVSTDLPAVRWIDQELIDFAAQPAAFVELVERRLEAPADPELVRRRQALAESHSWERRVDELLAHLQLRT